MLFNSLEFALFLPVVWALYWFIPWRSLRAQNALIIVASYVFYGWWDWRFLGLIALSTVVDYVVGLTLSRTEAARKRKMLLGISLATNLSLLGFFKYFNFFAESFSEVLAALGMNADPFTLKVVLPVGISFYTFQTLSYTIDIYRRELDATRDFVAFAAFVCFFPQLVAGPIERAARLLPQFEVRRSFVASTGAEGLRLILWGLCKKILMADLCASAVDRAFADYASYSSSELLLGLIFFAFQIYGDFSGYSDIARGTSKLFGFELMVNFRTPYFSTNFREFWRRWHISLSTWFRDYVYIPLGGSLVGGSRLATNLLVTFGLSGLWHGANWTFVVWGLLNGLYLLPTALLARAGSGEPGRSRFADALRMGRTFALTLIAWTFFRAESVSHATAYLGRMFTAGPLRFEVSAPMDYARLAIVGGVVMAEWMHRDREHPLGLHRLPVPVRWLLYCGLILMIGLLAEDNREFIYFQF